jgi:outer membrane protein TolC
MHLWAVFLFAQDTEKLSLREAVVRSLKNNSEIQVARFDPWIEEQSLLASYGVFDTTVFSRWQTTQSETPGTTFFSGAPVLEQITHDFSLGIRKRFPIGIQAELATGAHATQSNSAFALINPTWEDSLGLTLTIPILRDAGEESNLAVIRVQKIRHDMAIDTFEVSLGESVYGLVRSYHELHFAIENRRRTQRSLELSQRLLQENERKLAQGLIPKIQVTEAQAQVAQRQQDVLRAEQGHLNAVDRLRRAIDPLSMRTAASLYEPTDAPVVPSEEIDETSLFDQSVAAAFEHRADYRRTKRSVESAEVARVKAEHDELPRFDLLGRATLLGIDNTFNDAYYRMFDFRSHEIMGGFSFEFPIENSTAKYTAMRALLEVRKAQAMQRDLESRIVLEIREAVRDIRTQQKTLKSAEEQVRLAEERVTSENLRFGQGLTTTYFVLVAQNDLNTALLNQLRARIDLAVSLVNLRRATGQLLDDYQIEVAKELTPRE